MLWPKNRRASTSSSGRSGSEVKLISGSDAVPLIPIVEVKPAFTVRALSAMEGVSPPCRNTAPSSKVKRLPSRSSRPRTSSNEPTGMMSLVVPVTRSSPPSSASSPRPRIKIRFGARISTFSANPSEPPSPSAPLPSPSLSSPISPARARVARTIAGSLRWVMSGMSVEKAKPVSGMRISVSPISMVPLIAAPPVNGPASDNRPSSEVR